MFSPLFIIRFDRIEYFLNFSLHHITHTGIMSSSGLMIRPTPAASDSYSDLALLSMKRILSSFSDVRNFGTKVCHNVLFVSIPVMKYFIA